MKQCAIIKNIKTGNEHTKECSVGSSATFNGTVVIVKMGFGAKPLFFYNGKDQEKKYILLSVTK